MGVDHTGKTADSDAEKAEKSPADKQGPTGQPSRLESKAAAARPEDATEQRDERTPPVGEKPAATSQEQPGEESEQDSADRGSVTEADDRSPEDLGRQTDTDTSETDDPPTAGPGPEQPARATDAGAQDEPGQGTDTDAEGEPESPPENEVWDEFASKPASYELDGRQFGYRTWGEEFAARRASREAAGQAGEIGSTEALDEPPVQDEAPAEGQQNAADEGTAGPGTAPDAESKAGDEGDDVADQNEAWPDHTGTMRTKWAELESELAADRPPEKNDQDKGPPDETTTENSKADPPDEPLPKEWDDGTVASEPRVDDDDKERDEVAAESHGRLDDESRDEADLRIDDPLETYKKAVRSPQRVFRGDTRSPDEIFINGDGFRARGTSNDLKSYAELNEPSRFIGTSTTEDAAKPFTVDAQGAKRKLHGWVYEIESPEPAINVNKALGLKYRFILWGQAEKEMAFLDHIPREYIKSGHEVRGLSYTGKTVENPHFRGR